MPSQIYSGANIGIDSQVIEVEIAVSYGLRSFNIVGLPAKSVQEAKERVCLALKSNGFKSPIEGNFKVVVNLAPADLEKRGSHYDLAIALNFLIETKQARFETKDKLFIGELSLDGRLKPVKGVLSLALLAKKQKFKEIILPKKNSHEANLVNLTNLEEDLDVNGYSCRLKDKPVLKIIGVETVKEAVDYLENKKDLFLSKIQVKQFFKPHHSLVDFCYIKGQELTKRALEIAAAGGHNIFMFGPPGSGKTILAKAISSILPKLSFQEALEVTKIHSLFKTFSSSNPLILYPPVRSPHHTSSKIALIGGGPYLRPGEITMAHRGVLFLDEFPEFNRDVLESLRQPVEEKKITILRAKYSLLLPCSFILVLAANPCPCGFLNDPERECKCSPAQINGYQRKFSGPLMDRIDLLVEVANVKYDKLSNEELEEPSAIIRARVEKARAIQRQRFGHKKISLYDTNLNSQMNIIDIKQHCSIDSQSHSVLRKYVDTGQLSARGYHRVLKVSRTIADLDASNVILFEHLTEALMYRVKIN